MSLLCASGSLKLVHFDLSLATLFSVLSDRELNSKGKMVMDAPVDVAYSTEYLRQTHVAIIPSILGLKLSRSLETIQITWKDFDKAACANSNHRFDYLTTNRDRLEAGSTHLLRRAMVNCKVVVKPDTTMPKAE
ncbi:uncharacterized protein BDZ99DRAFT_465699 [Mytilinidion resinicola]|uniref:Uncharacterized protein n=1 Tax=Mytilinidion resinicola TaxID=574789 RepID=A0A6A6YEF4_9PEZI|nr:uncharacterized protein BDZ99DRAFT_465699 [Mytilinidion resinicola]KAF2806948.1 hypothetical protein BDZ99DRAFT_465699 [Mytilinidion resinicola]